MNYTKQYTALFIVGLAAFIGNPLIYGKNTTSQICLARGRVTLQKTTIFEEPLGNTFDIIVTAKKDGNRVTLTIPAITQTFPSTAVGENFDIANYPALPLAYPLGGYVDTVGHNLPAAFRPTSGAPITFYVASANAANTGYVGSIDSNGRIQFSGANNLPVEVGDFATLPTTVTYLIDPKVRLRLCNFAIAPGKSSAARWNPADFPPPVERTSISFDFGDYEDIKSGFRNGNFYPIWADNSANFPENTQNQPFKSMALAKVKVGDFGKKFKIQKYVNLSRQPIDTTLQPNGSILPTNATYGEGSIAIDPTNENNLAVVYQQRKRSRNGFVLSRSFDGGKTWSNKLLGAEDPNNPGQPLDSTPLGGTDVHIIFDRFGGLWILYLHVSFDDKLYPNVPFADHHYLLYSSDKGHTFTVAVDQTPLAPDQFPAGDYPFYQSLDFGSLATGPDATNTNFDSVWVGVDDAFNGNNNTYQVRVYGLRIRGLGIENIDLPSRKEYILRDGYQFSWLDVTPSGAVVLSRSQGSPQGTGLDLNNNMQVGVNVLYNGLADNEFGPRRDIIQTALGNFTPPPAMPHRKSSIANCFMVAVDKSKEHPGRIYVILINRLNTMSKAFRPYLIWSDDLGLSWSSPVNVSTDRTANTDFAQNIAVDPATGVVAVTWLDARQDVTGNEQGNQDNVPNTNVRLTGVFLDPRQLK